jgi:hypothetical protein
VNFLFIVLAYSISNRFFNIVLTYRMYDKYNKIKFL